MRAPRALAIGGALALLPACAGLFTDAEPPITFTALSAGGDHTCALSGEGAAYCWGRGETGELGDGRVRSSAAPVAVAGGHAYAAISAGEHHTCALTAAGQAHCWGWNQFGQLGTGSTVGLGLPTAVAGEPRFSMISSGAAHTCALTLDGEAYCWGDNGNGQLGNGTADGSVLPVAVAGGLRFAAISSGNAHTCALTPDGAAYCWGLNHLGQLGDGSLDNAWQPHAVAGGRTFASIGAGAAHTCGAAAAGGVYCWGSNGYGELGNAVIEAPRQPGGTAPVAVYGGAAFTAAAAGVHVTCAVDGGPRAHCWGRGFYGQIGNGTTVNWATPQPVADTPPQITPAALRVTAVDVGGSHACALSTTGDIYCWGAGELGQLGNPAYTFTTVPVRVSTAG